MGFETPWLRWETRGAHYIYALDWTLGAAMVAVAAAALVGSTFWVPRAHGSERSRPASVMLAVVSAVVLAAAGALALDLAWSRVFEGLLGRCSSDAIEQFGWPIAVQVGTSITAGLWVAGAGLRAARRGVGWPATTRHLWVLGATSIALGCGLWSRPSTSLAVLELDHPVARPRTGERAWMHASATWVPEVRTTLPGWHIETVRSWRAEGALHLEARAVRGPLSSTREFSIPLVPEEGHPRLPLAVGRRFRFEEVALGTTWDVGPWNEQRPPRELTLDVVADRWVAGRHLLTVERTVNGTRESLEVYASNGVWWASLGGRLRLRLRESLVRFWLGQCAPPTPPEPLLCRHAHRLGWRQVEVR